MINLKNDVGVIVGRFQVPYLHAGHQFLLKTVFDKHQYIIIFIGKSETLFTERDPLDYLSRVTMLRDWISENYDSKNVYFWNIVDCKSDEYWNHQLNALINLYLKKIPFEGSPILYGSRDSFIQKYQGPYPTYQIDATHSHNGTDIRKNILEHPDFSSEDFRKGMIYASFLGYPTVYSTVDIALLTHDGFLVLGKKAGEKNYCLIGGFVDPTDRSFEAAACREVVEETGVSLVERGLNYLCNMKIEDWRYKNSKDSVITHLYCATLIPSDSLEPRDDIEELRIFSLPEAYQNIISEHIPLLHKVRDFMEKNNYKTTFRIVSDIYTQNIFTRKAHVIHT